MLYVSRSPNKQGGWVWRIGDVTLAHSYVAASTAPGLFLFVISGVHGQGAELFSAIPRAEALLKKHLGGEVAFGEQAPTQRLMINRDDRWVKLQHSDPPEKEQDSYTYTLGNVFLASLSNIKNIQSNGYHLQLSRGPSWAPSLKVLSVSEGERLLIQSLACAVDIQRRAVSYGLGPNQLPCSAEGFTAQPMLYDGSPAW